MTEVSHNAALESWWNRSASYDHARWLRRWSTQTPMARIMRKYESRCGLSVAVGALYTLCTIFGTPSLPSEFWLRAKY